MSETPVVPTTEPTWNVLVVENDETIRRQIRESFADEVIHGRKLKISELAEIEQAMSLIRERKVDLVILDVFQGDAREGGDQTGVRVLDRIQETGFVVVVLYTALPESVAHHANIFVRVVGKDAGLAKLQEEIGKLFALRIPQLHRAVVNHFDATLCRYMWDFVQ